MQRFKPVYRRAAKKQSSLSQKLTAAGISLGVICLAVILAVLFFLSPADDGLQKPEPEAQKPQQRASFVAVGDNIPNDVIGRYADACAGETGDGLYDYTPIYAAIKPYIQKADLAYISFETHAGGDNIGPRGWPSFNTTDAMVDAIFDTGFNMIASATNHSYDWGYFGALDHSANLWKQKPVLFTGTATNAEDAYAIQTIERNGITVALLSYTYGVNGFSEQDLPPYAVNFMHEARMRDDIARAREVSDFVIVAVHWGTENQFEPDWQQLHYAQIMADAGADMVLGSHPHVIGPLVWLEGAEGNKTLVAYSLGNFLACHALVYPENELQGMLSCDFVKDEDGSRIENVRWIPLVNHPVYGEHCIYALKDYTPELAARNTTYTGIDDPISWMKNLCLRVIGPEVEIDY